DGDHLGRHVVRLHGAGLGGGIGVMGRLGGSGRLGGLLGGGDARDEDQGKQQSELRHFVFFSLNDESRSFGTRKREEQGGCQPRRRMRSRAFFFAEDAWPTA